MSSPVTRRAFLQSTSLLPLSAALVGGGLAATPSWAQPPPPQRVGGPKLRLSLNAFCFNQQLLNQQQGKQPAVTLFDVLDFCAQHDFEAIDPTGYYFPGYPNVPTDAYLNDFKRRAFQLGLAISGTGIRNDFAQPDAEKRAADVRLAKAWIEVAAKLGAPVIRLFAGAVPKGYEEKWEEVSRWMIDSLRECTEYGKKFGVVVGVQNHGDMLKTAEQTLAVVKGVSSDWFGVIVDTGSFLTPDPYADIARVVPYAVNWQVKESPVSPNSPVRTDLPRLIRIIREGGYRGYVPIETLSATGKPYDPFAIVPPFAAEVRAAMSGVAMKGCGGCVCVLASAASRSRNR